MNERYVKLPAAILELEEVIFTNVYINPFSIDCYFEASVEYPDEENRIQEMATVRVLTRFGKEMDILLPIDEFESKTFR